MCIEVAAFASTVCRGVCSQHSALLPLLASHKLRLDVPKSSLKHKSSKEASAQRMARAEVDYAALKKKYPRFAVDEVRVR